jgi:membrane-associated phospholipid phosphatase
MPITAPKPRSSVLAAARRRVAAQHGSAHRSPARAAAAFATGALAGTAFAAVAVASARQTTTTADTRIHAEAVAPAVDQAAKWWVYAPAALAAAVGVLAAPGRRRGRARSRQGRRVGAAVIAAVPAAVTALSPAFDRWLPQPPVGPRRRPLDHPVFPSGHAFRATAVALTAGYVVAREGLARPGRAGLLAGVAPAAVGLSRLVREKHLASDVVGGWLAGATLAALAAGAYELARAPGRGPARRGRRR